jgi:spermidine/putrescine-binding protein
MRYGVLIVLLAGWFLAACQEAAAPTPTAEASGPVAITLRSWEGDISQEILDSFEAEYGIKVNYLPYTSQEEVVAELQAGKSYDVVVLENQLIPSLVADDCWRRSISERAELQEHFGHFRDLT